MLCPICFKTIENPTWKTCHSKKCGIEYRKKKKEKAIVANIDIKDVRNKINSNKEKILYLQKDTNRLLQLRKLYLNAKKK